MSPDNERRARLEAVLSGVAPRKPTTRPAPAKRRGPAKPRTMSLETRAKISASKRGVPQSPAHRAKMGKASIGVPRSAEVRAKISAGMKEFISKKVSS